MIYAIRALRQLALLAFLGMFILMGAFVVEKFEFLLNFTLRYNLRASEFTRLLFSYLPKGLNFISPIAVLIATYITFLARRENLEFVALAAAGGTRRAMLAIGSIAAAASLVISVFISGYLEPYSSFVFHTTYKEAKRQLVEHGPQRGTFFRAANNVLYVTKSEDRQDLSIRLFNFDGSQLRSVFGSPCAQTKVSSDRLFIELCSVVGTTFRTPIDDLQTANQSDCTICPFENRSNSLVAIKSGESTIELDGVAALALLPRQHEKLLHQLLKVKDGRFLSQRDAAHMLDRILLSLVTAMAVPLALLAVALTSSATRYIALPGAIVAVAALTSLAGVGGLIPPASITLPSILGGVGLAVFFVAAVLVFIVTRFTTQLTKPALGRF